MSAVASQEQVQTACILTAQSDDDTLLPVPDKLMLGGLDAASDVISKSKSDSLGRSSLVGELLGKLEKLTILIGSDQDAMHKITASGTAATGDSGTGGMISRQFLIAATPEPAVLGSLQLPCSTDRDEQALPITVCIPPSTAIQMPLALSEASTVEASAAAAAAAGGSEAVVPYFFAETPFLCIGEEQTLVKNLCVNRSEHSAECAEAADSVCYPIAAVCGSTCDDCTSGRAAAIGSISGNSRSSCNSSSDNCSDNSAFAHEERAALPEDSIAVEDGARASLQLFESVLQEVAMLATRESDGGSAEVTGVAAAAVPTIASVNHPTPLDPPLADILLEEELLWITGGLAAAAAATAAEPSLSYAVGDLVDEGECGICLGAVGLVAPVRRRLCCLMPVCQSCISMYFAVRVAEGCAAIQCPAAACASNVAKDEVADFLSPELRIRYYRIIENANCSPYAKTCPHCCHLNTIDVETVETPAAKRSGLKVACAVCSFSWCFPCHAPWHEGTTCNQYRHGDKALKLWAKEKHFGQLNARKCPRCKILIQRVSGCDHIHCKQCETDFCYRCGKRHVRVRFIGDHYDPLSVLGCPYAFMQGKQKHLRRFVRGSIFTGQMLAVPVGIALAVGLLPIAVATVAIAGPVLGFMRLHRHLKQRKQAAKRRRSIRTKMSPT